MTGARDETKTLGKTEIKMTDLNQALLEDFGFNSNNAEHGSDVVTGLLILEWGAQFLPSDFGNSLVRQARRRKLSSKQAHWVPKLAGDRRIPYAVLADTTARIERFEQRFKNEQ